MFLAPWIIFSIPSRVLLGLQLPLVVSVSGIGLLGTIRKSSVAAATASLILLVLMVGGKVGADIIGNAGTDTSILLAQFIAVIFFTEASSVVLSFDKERLELAGKSDELSQSLRKKLVVWAQGQLLNQALVIIAAFGLSLALLIVGGFGGISINQIFFSGALVLTAVVALLFLLTNRREPERRRMARV